MGIFLITFALLIRCIFMIVTWLLPFVVAFWLIRWYIKETRGYQGMDGLEFAKKMRQNNDEDVIDVEVVREENNYSNMRYYLP